MTASIRLLIVLPAVFAATCATSWIPSTAVAQTSHVAGPGHSLLDPDPAEAPVRRFKKQALQSVSVSGGWLGAASDGDLSSSFVEASFGTGIPLGSFDNILSVRPSFRADYIDAASGIDVPSELYETGVSFFYRRAFSDRLSGMAIVRPSLRSDFTTSDNAFRIFGLGLVNWEYRPQVLTLSAGAVFLDRADLPLLPAVGLTWTPQRRVKLDLRFPESRLNWRLQKDGCDSETWAYVSAGIGGNTWAVTRMSGTTDELSLRDTRVMIGIDHLTDGGGGWFAQTGLALNRRIEYESDQTEVELSNGILLQAGWRY